MVLDLINNAALLLALCWLQSLVSYNWSRHSPKAIFTSGLIFGMAAVAAMMSYIYLVPGLWSWVDSALVVVSVAALIYGPAVGGITAVVAATYRLWMGGLYAQPGVANIMLGLAAGLAFRWLVQREVVKRSWWQLLTFGAVLQAASFVLLFYVFRLPESGALNLLPTIIAIMAPATAILAVQLVHIERKKELELSIKKSEARLRAVTEAIPDHIWVLNRDGKILDILAPGKMARKAGEFLNKSVDDALSSKVANHLRQLIRQVADNGEAIQNREITAKEPGFDNQQENAERTFESKARSVDIPDMEGAVLVVSRDITERRVAENRVRFLAYFDPLTELPNRHWILEKGEQLFADDRRGSGTTVILVNLDHFRLVNEVFDFATGDQILKEVAGQLRALCSEGDLLARYSGDRFVIVHPNRANDEDLTPLCTRILQAIGEHDYMPGGSRLNLQASIGLACSPRHGDDLVTLIKNAGIACEEALKSGSQKYRYYEAPMGLAIVEEQETRNALSRALLRDEFELFYQPQHSLQTGEVVGVEALIRWNHPGHGQLYPGAFLAVAEDSGLIVPIGEWVLQRACEQAARWYRQGIPFGTMAVNISTVQLERSAVENTVAAVLSQTGLPPSMLNLELMESTLLRGLEHAFVAADELKRAGVGFTLDDFGTGFTRLDQLERLNIQRLTIDMKFVRNLANSDRAHSLTNAIVQMAQSLDLETTAEGVEDQHTAELLKALGCDNAQGYLYSKPLPAHAMEAYLLEQHTPTA